MSQRLSMIEKSHEELSVRRQCILLSIHRSRVYYKPKAEDASTLLAMKRLDELYTAHPFLGYRKMTTLLKEEGWDINHKKVRRLLRMMGLRALYPEPGNSSKPNPENKVYPYLLKGVDIIKPNQVWATDITYIPIKGSWAYLVAIIDWYSRYVLSWRLSSTMETDFCIDALRQALETHGKPHIFNSDQGSQFTSHAFTSVLTEAQVNISMDGRGSYHDNIFTERLWRSVKYEEVYIKEYKDFQHAHQSLEQYFQFYNYVRPHQSLDYQKPARVHFHSCHSDLIENNSSQQRKELDSIAA